MSDTKYQLRIRKLRGKPLTNRERETLMHISWGKNPREAAVLMGIKTRTAETHRKNIAIKLGTYRTALLTRYWLEHYEEKAATKQITKPPKPGGRLHRA